VNRRNRWITGAAIAVALVAGGTAFAVASSDDDRPLKGSVLEQASAAALERTGGGTVVEAETGDDGAAYGVEVRLDDGSVVEVRLDASFHVIGQDADDEGSGQQDETGEED
jgi:hypothetical protein